MKTAAQTLYEQQRRDEHEMRLHRMHRTFAEKYAPDDPRDRDLFGADLAMLLRELQMDTLKPFHEAAAHQLAIRPMPPVFIKADDASIASRDFSKPLKEGPADG